MGSFSLKALIRIRETGPLLGRIPRPGRSGEHQRKRGFGCPATPQGRSAASAPRAVATKARNHLHHHPRSRGAFRGRPLPGTLRSTRPAGPSHKEACPGWIVDRYHQVSLRMAGGRAAHIVGGLVEQHRVRIAAPAIWRLPARPQESRSRRPRCQRHSLKTCSNRRPCL